MMAGNLALRPIGVSDKKLDETYQLIDLKTQENVHLLADSLEDTGEVGSPANDPENNTTTSSNRWEVVCIILAAGTAVMSVVSAGAVQVLHQSVPHGELNLGRFIFVPFMLLPFIIRRKCDLRVERRRLKWMIPAWVLVYVDNLVCYGSFYYLPLGNAICCIHTMKIVVLAAASLLFREFSIGSIVGALLCLVSVVLVVQPDFIFGIHESGNVTIDCFSMCLNDEVVPSQINGSSGLAILGSEGPIHEYHDQVMNITNTSDLFNTATSESFHRELKGYVMAFGAGLVIALVCLMYNRPLRDVDPVVMGFWTSMFGIVTATGQMLLTETPTLPDDCWFCLTMFGLHAFLVGAGSIIYLILNQKTTRPLVMAITSVSIEVPLDFLVQYSLLSDMYPGHRNWAEYLGIGLCLVGLLLGPVYQLVHSDRNGRK